LVEKLIALGWVEIVDQPTVVDRKSNRPAEALKFTEAGIKALAERRPRSNETRRLEGQARATHNRGGARRGFSRGCDAVGISQRAGSTVGSSMVVVNAPDEAGLGLLRGPVEALG